MTRSTKRWGLLLGVVVLWVAGAAAAQDELPLFHRITVRLDPAAHTVDVVDRLELQGRVEPDGDGAYRFALHAALKPRVVGRGWRLKRIEAPVDASFFGINATSETVAEDVPLQGWALIPGKAPDALVELRYSGEIHHALDTQGEEYQRSFSETPGIVDERGVFLAGTTYWLPTFGDGLVVFDLEVAALPDGWAVISQGRRTPGEGSVLWECPYPTEEVYLVGGPLVETCDGTGDVEVCAFLREPDPALAHRYLTATRRYLQMYESMLPPYPYLSFALVENFWETGYGMPGFTLLGPKVIRFPWILTSSYPHELLHNWWGNSVYVDVDAGGNWCEGLTSYMADHMFAEQRGEGALYRRTLLKKYTDFAVGEDDFPLAEFRSRSSAASEAVGYGKSAMVLHMARRQMGDEAFTGALSAFYGDHLFTHASFDDLAVALDGEQGERWQRFFEHWTGRTGAPRLELGEVTLKTEDEITWTLDVSVKQAQEGEPYPLLLPVAVTVEGQDEPLWLDLVPEGRTFRGRLDCPSRPVRLDVDPAFDVMRQLDPLEVPPSLSTLFGADSATFVLPAGAAGDELAAWRALATAWAAPAEPDVVMDEDLLALPAGAVWLLGHDNRHRAAVLDRLASHGVAAASDGVTVDGEEVPRDGHSLVLVARSAQDPADAVGWIAADPGAAIAGLTRKLPHYSRYSFLAFKGDEPTNTRKGQWDPLDSPLAMRLGGQEMAPPPSIERAALAEPPPPFDSAALLATVQALTADDMDGRGLGSQGLDRATDWVEGRMEALGLEPAGEHGYRQTFEWVGHPVQRHTKLTNLVGRIAGTDPALADQPVVVMAHLDHLGRGWPDVRSGNEGLVHPGADDNASGVAVLLELAGALSSAPPAARPVLFAAVTGEEAGLLGSRHLLASMNTMPSACLNLDTVGRLADGSILVLDAHSAREWRFIFMGVGHTLGIPVVVSAEPLDSSDQGACIERGVPGVQLTTGPHADYHRPGDTAGSVDPDGMVTVTAAAHEAVVYLTGRVEPLTVAETAAEPGVGHPGGGHPGGGHPGGGHPGGGHPGGGHPGGARKATLGTVPDFTFQGEGVKVYELVEGSPAVAAGIQAGDILRELAGEPVDDLRDLSELLKVHAPGDRVELVVLRDGTRVTLIAELAER